MKENTQNQNGESDRDIRSLELEHSFNTMMSNNIVHEMIFGGDDMPSYTAYCREISDYMETNPSLTFPQIAEHFGLDINDPTDNVYLTAADWFYTYRHLHDEQ